jgi:hypothetical protein
MIKVFLFYPNSVPHPTKNSTFSHPQYSTGSEQNDVLIYLLYLTKDSEKKKITMVKPFARSSGMDILNLAAPPGQSLRDGLAGDPYEGFYLIT